jgi:hypothetical protein
MEVTIMGLGLLMSCSHSLSLKLMWRCKLCGEEMEFEEHDDRKDHFLGLDPVHALADNRCPLCYENITNKQTKAYSNKVAKWIQQELRKRLPEWRRPVQRIEEVGHINYIGMLLMHNDHQLADEFNSAGGYRGMYDPFCDEWTHSSLAEKRALLFRLNEWGVNDTMVRHTCIRLLEHIGYDYAEARLAAETADRIYLGEEPG